MRSKGGRTEKDGDTPVTPRPVHRALVNNDIAISSGTAGLPGDMHAVFVPGFWLGAWAWREVEPPLRAAGITTHPVTLPGLDGRGTAGVTLAQRIETVTELVDSLVGDVVLVGHSGGGAVVQGVIDRRPERVRRVVYVDSGPLRDGVALMPDAEADVPLPAWDELTAQGSSLEGMGDMALVAFRERGLPEPVGVVSAPVRVADERRNEVPASVVCTSFDAATLRDMIQSGALPSELGAVHDVRFVDLPTGHWPMFSRPIDLAAVLVEEILR